MCVANMQQLQQYSTYFRFNGVKLIFDLKIELKIGRILLQLLHNATKVIWKSVGCTTNYQTGLESVNKTYANQLTWIGNKDKNIIMADMKAWATLPDQTHQKACTACE